MRYVNVLSISVSQQFLFPRKREGIPTYCAAHVTEYANCDWRLCDKTFVEIQESWSKFGTGVAVSTVVCAALTLQ